MILKIIKVISTMPKTKKEWRVNDKIVDFLAAFMVCLIILSIVINVEFMK